MTRRILIAGIGNIFLGDDAFGVETVQALLRQPLPEGVRAVDFGIRSYDLAYAILDGYDEIILVDATSRKERPGTVYLIEIDPEETGEMELMNPHSMNPAAVLQMVQSLGGKPAGRFHLVGCEPAVLETENGAIGLSPQVRSAVPMAIEMIRLLLTDLTDESKEPGLMEAQTGVKSYA